VPLMHANEQIAAPATSSFNGRKNAGGGRRYGKVFSQRRA
jgi:hypothetical protein